MFLFDCNKQVAKAWIFKSENVAFFNIVYIFPVFSGCILIKTQRNKYGLFAKTKN